MTPIQQYQQRTNNDTIILTTALMLIPATKPNQKAKKENQGTVVTKLKDIKLER